MKKLFHLIKLVRFSLLTVNCLLFTAHCSLYTANAQQITNCRFEQQNKKVVVYYDISGAKAGQTFNVSLYLSADAGKTWQGPLSGGLIGDVGSKISSGSGKQITWDVLASREKLEGDNIIFEIRALPEGGVNYTETAGGVNIEMVFVKGGTFTMGCTSEQGGDCGDDEKPAHSVTLSDYYIGKYEVTQAQWKVVMGASASLSDPSNFKGCDNCPVENVSWNDIQEFITKLNRQTGKKYGLPSEAQWEYSARGVASTGSATATKYSGSNNIGAVAWYSDNSGSKTHPVGQKQPNELGIFDMSGNVWEWCSDSYGSYSSGSQTNPTGSSSGSYRVLRGGSWYDGARYCRSANRIYSIPVNRFNFNGFRLVLLP